MILFDLQGNISLGDNANVTNILININRNVQEAEKKFIGLGQAVSKAGKVMGDIGSSLTQNVTMPIVGFFGQAAKASMDFSQQLANTGAVSGATEEEMGKLREEALRLGKDTKYSALEVAQGQEEMIKAGRNLNQVFDETDDVLAMATAGGLEVAEAAEIGSNMLNMFSKEGVTMEQVANQMAGAANASATDVKSLGFSLKYVGPIAASLDIPFNDLNATLGVLANNGIKGSSAGTGLRQMLTRLQPASDKAAATMSELGLITADGANIFYDAQGKIKPMSEIIGILTDKMGGLTDQQKSDKLKTMFGLIASPTINTLMKAGASSIGEMAENISKVTAAEVAAQKLDTLAGSVEFLQGSWETFLIQIGSILEPFIKKVVDGLAFILDGFLSMGAPMQTMLVAVLALVAGLGPLLVVISSIIGAVGFLATGITGIAGLIAAISTPLLVVVGVLGTLTAAIGYVVWSLGFLSDGFQIVKSFLTGDIKNVMEMFVNVLGLSDKEARNLGEQLITIKQKGAQLIDWISSNATPIFEVLKDAILGVDFTQFDNSTKTSRTFFGDFIGTIIKDISDFTTYMYKLLDSFGLLPVKIKYANDEVAGKYVELHAKVEKSLSDIYNANVLYGNLTYSWNVAAYAKKIEETKKFLDDEYKMVDTQLKKKKEKEITAMSELFADSDALKKKNETEVLTKIKAHYDNEETYLKKANDAKKLILDTALKEKRELTKREEDEIERIKEESEKSQVAIVSNGKISQRRILEDASRLAIKSTIEESLEVVSQANRQYDEVIKTARKQKNEKIDLAIKARDETGSLSAGQAKKIIDEANNEYKGAMYSAKMLKDGAIDMANKRAGGTLTAAQKETRDTDEQSKKIKQVMLKVWDDLKNAIPGKIAELGGIIVRAIGSSIVDAAKNAMSGLWDVLTTDVKPRSLKIPAHASGVRNSAGGLALVGERGPELVRLPQGADVYSNAESNAMISDFGGGSVGTKANINVYISGNNLWDTRAVDELGKRLVTKLRGDLLDAY